MENFTFNLEMTGDWRIVLFAFTLLFCFISEMARFIDNLFFWNRPDKMMPPREYYVSALGVCLLIFFGIATAAFVQNEQNKAKPLESVKYEYFMKCNMDVPHIRGIH